MLAQLLSLDRAKVDRSRHLTRTYEHYENENKRRYKPAMNKTLNQFKRQRRATIPAQGKALGHKSE